MNPEWVGWLSAGTLLATLVWQVYSQWRSERISGISRWLFIGQSLASTGFLTYSYLIDNKVFMATNALLLLTALSGEIIYLRKRKNITM